jgi:hypothetical protein
MRPVPFLEVLVPRWFAAVATVLCLASCGTTVPNVSTTGSALTGDGLGTASPTGTTSGPQGGTGAGSTPGQATGTVTSPGGEGVLEQPVATTGPARAGRASAGIPAKGRGWDAKNVYVGIIVASDANAGLQALGISLNPGDMLGDARAIVNDLNRKGGLLGRTIKLVVRDDSSASVLADPSSAAQAACTYFAQDNPVISVVNTNGALDVDNFRACFEKARIPLTTMTTAAFDDQDAQKYSPYFYNALAMSWSRFADVFLLRLKGLGYFTGWNARTGAPSPGTALKVGVYYASSGAGARAGQRLIAGLTKAGTATDGFQYGSASGDAQAAVLRFASSGVTHVISDGALFFFSVPANSQGYRPRFGVTTYDAIQALLVSNGNKAQLNGAVGVGWYPTLDTEAAQDPGAGPGTKSCLDALRAGGQTFSGQRFAQAVGMAICDGLRFPVLAAQRAGALDPDSIRNGIVAIGAAFPTGGAFASGLSATNYALPGAGRDIAWDAKAQCFRYRGPLYRIG